MKVVFFLLPFLFGLHAVSFSQWIQQISGTNYRLHSVHFPAPDTGYVVGEVGTILNTINGGINWVQQTSGTTKDLSSVFFTDANHGYAVGTGVILKTTNGGSSWTITNIGPNTLRSVFFPDSTGYVAGLANGNVYKTTDRGNTWVLQPCISNGYGSGSVYFTSHDTGYVGSADAAIMKTTNGGINWTLQASGTSQPLHCVHFPCKDTGFFVGRGATILKTVNGGVNWVSQTSGTNGGEFLSVYFTDTRTGYIAGGNALGFPPGIILKTTNGGINWAPQTTPVNPVFTSVHFSSPDTGYVVGWGGTILKTNNGGIVGIEEKSKKKVINVHPNPASNKLTIDNWNLKKGEMHAAVYDIMGRQMENEIKSTSPVIEMDVSGLKEGMYFVKVKTPEEMVVKKIIVKH